MSDRYFFNTFGYLQIPVEKPEKIVEEFESEITENLGTGRNSGTRFSGFKNDSIYKVFYNDYVLETLKKLVDDFIVLSPIESFYIKHSDIHRDFGGVIKTIKLIYYLDDVSDNEKGPLYVLPGTQHIYDRYSSQVAMNVSWPPHYNGNTGSGFINHTEYLLIHAPKTFLYSNLDNIIIFNNEILHGSYGNHSGILRRAIAMTVMCIDKTNSEMVKKIKEFYIHYNVNPVESLAYHYCLKNNLNNWLEHFIDIKHNNIDFKQSDDYTDVNACLEMFKSQRYSTYVNNNMNHMDDSVIFNSDCLNDYTI
jgi:hypothetical protein